MIRQLDSDGNIIKEYDCSIREIARQTGISYAAISYAVNGTRKTAGGFAFQKLEDVNVNTDVNTETVNVNTETVNNVNVNTVNTGTVNAVNIENVNNVNTVNTETVNTPVNVNATVNTETVNVNDVNTKPRVRQIPKKDTYIDAFGVEVRTMPEIQEEKPEGFPGSNVVRHPEYFGNILETDSDIMSKLKGTVFNP